MKIDRRKRAFRQFRAQLEFQWRAPITAKQRKGAQQGQAIVLIALAMIALIGIAGLAIDGGRVMYDQRNIQNAVDASLIASGKALCEAMDDGTVDVAEASQVQAVGANAAQINGFIDGIDGITVLIETPYTPTSGLPADTTAQEFVRVRIEQPVDTYFIHVVFKGPVSVTSGGVMHCNLGFDFTPFQDVGIYACGCDPTGYGVDADGNGSIYSTTKIYSDCGVRSTGGAWIRAEDEILYNGPATATGGSTINEFWTPPSGPGTAVSGTSADGPNPACQPYPEPELTGCGPDWDINGTPQASADVSPGGGAPGSEVVTVRPGCYNSIRMSNAQTIVFDGSSGAHDGVVWVDQEVFVNNGTIRNAELSPGVPDPDSGVMFYLNETPSGTDGYTLTGGDQSLVAPTSGPWTNFLILQNDDAAIKIAGQGVQSATGIVYAPFAEVEVSGSSVSQFSFRGQIVANNFESSGQGFVYAEFEDLLPDYGPPSIGITE